MRDFAGHGRFPKHSFTEALRAASKLADMEIGEFTRDEAAAKLGRAKGGSTNTLLSALRSYNLLQRSAAGRLSLTACTKDLFFGNLSPRDRLSKLFECAFAPTDLLVVIDAHLDDGGERADLAQWIMKPLDHSAAVEWLAHSDEYTDESASQVVALVEENLAFLRREIRSTLHEADGEVSAAAKQAKPSDRAATHDTAVKSNVVEYQWELGGGVRAAVRLSAPLSCANQIALFRCYVDLLEKALA